MRNLTAHTKTEATAQLRADEYLVPCGGACGFDFFAAGSDEDFMPKEVRLRDRRRRKLTKKDRDGT